MHASFVDCFMVTRTFQAWFHRCSTLSCCGPLLLRSHLVVRGNDNWQTGSAPQLWDISEGNRRLHQIISHFRNHSTHSPKRKLDELLEPFDDTTLGQRPDGLLEDIIHKHISIIEVTRTDCPQIFPCKRTSRKCVNLTHCLTHSKRHSRNTWRNNRTTSLVY